MIDYKYADLFYEDSVDKQLKIEVEDGTVITNEDIFSESMTLTESLCSDSKLTFGSCEASKFEIKIANRFYSMKGLWLDVSETLTSNEPAPPQEANSILGEMILGTAVLGYEPAPPQEANSILGEMILGTAVLGYDGENWHPDHSDTPFVFGRYKVASDRPTADRSFREIVAYDALYDIINADAIKLADWYNTIFPTLYSTMTLKEFRDSFFENFDIEQEDTSLPNDNMIVERTIDTSSITGKDLVTAICEVNGCFGHIGRDGKFHYIFLPEINDGKDHALGADEDSFLASNTEDNEEEYFVIGTPFGKYAREAVDISKENWKSIDYEDYMTQPIDSLQLRDSTDDIGYVYNIGEGGNNYVIENNFLLYGKSSEDFYNVAINIFDRMSAVSYRPTNATLRGNPCLEVGDPIMLVSKYKTICTYILSRTLKGIQALEDNYVSEGDETYDNAYNGSSSIIDQLKGISNVLERNVESNTVRISNLDNEYTEIKQTINSISFTVSSSTATQEDLTNCQNFSDGKLPPGWWEDSDSSVGTYEYIKDSFGSYAKITSDSVEDFPGLIVTLGVIPAGSYKLKFKVKTENGCENEAQLYLAIYNQEAPSGSWSNTEIEYINITNSNEWVTLERTYERSYSSKDTQIQFGAYIENCPIEITDVQVLYPAEIPGALGGTASIVMKVGDEAITGDIDLSNVREAFANDESSIEISAGTILFSANTFLVDSNNLVIEADGSLSASDATFTGSMMSISGDFEVGVSDGYFRIYYQENEMGNIRSASFESTNYRGFTINIINADYTGFAINDILYYVLNNGADPYSTDRHQFEGSVLFRDAIYAEGYVYVNDNCCFANWNGGTDMGFTGGDVYTNKNCGISIGNIKLGDYMLRVEGEAYASGGWSGTSDENKKSGIKPLSEKTDSFLDKLNPISFNFKDDDDKKIHFGVTSQNVKEALEAEGIDPDESGLVGTALDEDGNEFGTLYYDELIAPLIYEVKELKSELKELKEAFEK